MPHYEDGQEARVGDQVNGKLYNTAGFRSGTIISITKGTESCNAIVAFVETVAIDGDPADRWRDLERHWVAGDPLQEKVPRMAVWKDIQSSDIARPVFRVVLGENHGSAGAAFAVFDCVDYTAISDLVFVARPGR